MAPNMDLYHAVSAFMTIPTLLPVALTPEVFQRHALKFEAAATLNLSFALSVDIYLAQGRSVGMLWYLLTFMACGAHPLCSSINVGIYVGGLLHCKRLYGGICFLDGGKVLVTTGFISSDILANSLAMSFYLVMACIFYWHSFTRKVIAIRDGCILSDQAPLMTDIHEDPTCEHQSCRLCLKFQLWWRRSTHQIISCSPMFARSFNFALLCSALTWLNHLPMMDLAVATILLEENEDNESCRLQTFLPRYYKAVTWLLCSLLLIIVPGRRMLAGYPWAHRFRKDLPLLLVSAVPCCGCLCVHGAVRLSCFEGQPDSLTRWQFTAQTAELCEISCLQMISLMILARVHPVTNVLAVLAFVAMLTVVLEAYDVHPGVMILLMLHNITLVVLPNVLDDILLVRSVWTAVSRSQANAMSVDICRTWDRAGSDLELAQRQPGSFLASAEWPPWECSRPRDASCLEPSHLHAMQTVAEENAADAAESDPRKLPEPAIATEGRAAQPSEFSYPLVAILRHAERQDAAWDSAWHRTEDAKQHPVDCPITGAGIVEARRMAETLRQFGDFGIIVASPYLRCVQTAIVIADELDLVVLLDQQIGEVYGPAVFGGNKTFPSGHAWRSRKELHRTLLAWSKELPSRFCKTPVERVCWKRILGKAPFWGERLPEARLRYARRLLTYLSRSRRANKNVVLVSHGHMIQTALKVFPATAADEVESVRYCGGLMARFRDAFRADSDPKPSFDFATAALTPSTSTETLGETWVEVDVRGHETLATSDQDMQLAEVQRWHVHTLGVRFVSRGVSGPGQSHSLSEKLQGEFLAEVGAGKFSWPQLRALLGKLPSELPSEAFTSHSSKWADADLSDSATQSSMDMFKRPRAGSFQTSGSVSTAEVVVETEPTAPAAFTAFNLSRSSLLARRNLSAG